LVKDWVQAIAQQDASLLSSSIETSIESHLMAFAAEKSRLNRTIENISLLPGTAASIPVSAPLTVSPTMAVT